MIKQNQKEVPIAFKGIPSNSGGARVGFEGNQAGFDVNLDARGHLSQ